MLCPTCKTALTMSERQGIEIDYCPTCRGVWLDRGELDKIIERGAPPPSAAPPVEPRQQHYPPQQAYPQPTYHEQQTWGRSAHDKDRNRGKRRKSFLEELFD